MEVAVHGGRTRALRIAAEGWGEHGLVVPRIRHLPGYRIPQLFDCISLRQSSFPLSSPGNEVMPKYIWASE